MKQNHEVVEKQAGAVALAGQFEEDAGSGFETADASSYAIPFLTILQQMSPQCKKSDGAYISGAEEGQLYNSVTQQRIDGETGVVVIPVTYKRSFVRWAPRNSGGGFKGEFKPSEVESGNLAGLSKIKDVYFMDVPAGVDPFDKDGKPAYDFLADTRTHYVLVLDGKGGYQPAVISMASTQIKKSRQWMAKMNGIKMQRTDGSHYTPAMFSHQYRLTTTVETKATNSWYGWKIETLGAVESAEVYQAAKAFRDAISSGEAKEQVPAEHVSGDATEEF